MAILMMKMNLHLFIIRLNFPVTFGALRILPEDAVIDGYLVPKGVKYIFGLYFISKDI